MEQQEFKLLTICIKLALQLEPSILFHYKINPACSVAFFKFSIGGVNSIFSFSVCYSMHHYHVLVMVPTCALILRCWLMAFNTYYLGHP